MSDQLSHYFMNLDATLIGAALGGFVLVDMLGVVINWRLHRRADECNRWQVTASWSWPAAIFVLALVLRLINIGGESFWYDEAFTARLTSLDIFSMIHATAGDVHPPLWYLVAKAASFLPVAPEIALRLPAAIFGALAAMMVYRIALGDSSYPVRMKAAQAAGLLAATLPGLLRYGQEARGYGLLAFLILLAYDAQARRQWTRYTAALALALYTHPFALLYVLPLAYPHRRKWAYFKKRLAATGLALLIFAPWAVVLAGQIGHVASGFWIRTATPGQVLEPMITLVTGYRSPAAITLALLIGAFALTFAGIERFFRTESITASPRLLIFLFLPPCLAAAASVLAAPIYQAKGFIASVYMLPALWVGFWPFLARHWKQAIPVVTAAALLIGLTFFYYPNSNTRQDIPALIAELDLQPGDSIYHTEIGSYILIAHYTPPGVENYIFPYASDLSQSLTAETKAVMQFPDLALDQVIRETSGRVFIMLMTVPGTSQTQVQEIERIHTHYLLIPVLQNDYNRLQIINVYQVAGHT